MRGEGYALWDPKGTSFQKWDLTFGGPRFPCLGNGWADTGFSGPPWELRELPPVTSCTGEALWLPWPWGALSGRTGKAGADQTPCLVCKDWPWHLGARQPPLLSSLFSSLFFFSSLLLLLYLLFSIHSVHFSLLLYLSPSSPLSPSQSTFQPRGEKQGRFPSSPWRCSRQ